MRELRDIRLRRGLSQADLSAKTGVAEFTISQIEAGKRANPRPSTLRKLAQALDVEVADLYGSPERPLAEAPPSSEQPPLNGFEEARRSEDALRDPTSSEEAFRQAVEMAPTGALHYRLDELVRDYHESPKREGLRNQPREEVISRVKAFARATIIGEELKHRGEKPLGEKPLKRHNLALKAFEKAISDAAPAGYEEQEGQEAG